MTKKDETTHPLSEVFNMSENEDFKDSLFKLEIPENPTQEDIARIALEAYGDIMRDTIHLQPRYRARTLEVASLFLKLAHDSVAKNSDTKIKSEKLDLDKDKFDHKTGNKKPEAEKTCTRSIILNELNEIKKQNEA